MTVSVVVPFNPDGAERSRNWAWVEKRLATFHPDYEIVVAGDDSPIWTKAKAVQRAVERSSGDVLVMMDADVFIHPEALELAVASVSDSRWIAPHSKVYRFAPHVTGAIVAGPPLATHERLCCKDLDRDPYPGTVGGGIAVLTRNAWDRCPMDPRFEGWRGEDQAWGMALQTLVAPKVRLGWDLFHLWHPEQPTRRLRGNQGLLNRYSRAAGRPHLMERIVKEIACAPSEAG